jgi:hypothetical protein
MLKALKEDPSVQHRSRGICCRIHGSIWIPEAKSEVKMITYRHWSRVFSYHLVFQWSFLTYGSKLEWFNVLTVKEREVEGGGDLIRQC